jgi:osmotically-inducible protein OsmY
VSDKNYRAEDEASYYQGDHFEIGGAPVGPEADEDEKIFKKVCEILDKSDSVDPTKIEVKVLGGVVYLSGTVSEPEMINEAQEAVSYLPGLKDVINELRTSK